MNGLAEINAILLKDRIQCIVIFKSTAGEKSAMEPETSCRGVDEGKLPCEHEEDGPRQEVWLTTQLDSAIGDLQSVAVQSKSVQETALVSAECENASEGKRRATKKKRRQKPRIIPTIRIFVGTFVHATQEEPMVILEKWMIGVDGGKVSSC